jgi:hypothetical protein
MNVVEPRAKAVAVGLAPALVEQRDHAGERLQLAFLRAAQLEAEQPLARAVQQGPPRRLGQVLPRHLRVERQLLGQLLEERACAG